MKSIKNANRLLEDLNSWNAEELLAHNSKEPDFLVSGETSGYIQVKLDQIRSLGYNAEWSEESKKYYLVNKGTRK